MFAFVRCVAQAVAEVGVRGLANLVPGGKFTCDVAANALAKYRVLKRDRELRDDIRKLACATFDEARVAGEEAAKAAAPDADPQDQLNLELYLTQIPASVQASLKRPDDPTGKTVPAEFALNTPDDVLKMLPARLPRFRSGDALPGAPGWVLVEQLGAGGFGEVWLARFGPKAAQQGAVKFCHGLNTRDLRHEIRLVGRVMGEVGEHPGIVPLLAENLDADPPWVMYEYVAGGDLVMQIRGWVGLQPEERARKAVAALRELAETVGRFHRLKPAVVHRDLKPTNILRDRVTGRYRVTDFGIGGVAAAAALRAEQTGGTSSGGRLLSNLRGSHTPLYASPQQRDGADPDPRDDVHALGVIGYQLFTGHLGQSVGTDFDDDLRDAGASAGLIQVLKRCTAQKPERRWATATELVKALDEYAPPPEVSELTDEDEAALAADYARWRTELHKGRPLQAWLREFAPPRIARWRGAAERNDPRGQALLGCSFQHGAGVPHNYFWAMTWFKKAAGHGDALAEFCIGALYFNGHGIPEDYVRAMAWYRKAANQGDALALYHIGLMHHDGHGVPQDSANALAWYRKAADLGHAPAQNSIGCLLLEGRGVPRDIAEAVDWFQKAADQGDADAQYNLGLLYRDGNGVPRDDAQALEWFRRAADQGHAAAQGKLGSMYRSGRGVPRDLAAAVDWFSKAAVQGNAAAQTSLGSMFRDGHGVPRDDGQAMEWFSRAAEQGDADAMCAIGALYADGCGVRREFAQALRWFRRAAERGHAEAEFRLGCLYEHGNGVPQDHAEALSCFRRAAEHGHADALYAIGRFYRNGHGVTQNEAQALEWYRKAADRGHADAQLCIGVLYSKGRGVAKDSAVATLWFRKAAAQGNEAAKGWLKSLGVS